MNGTETDYDLIRGLRDTGVLKDIQAEKMPTKNGTIIIPCADGERFADLFTKHLGLCNGSRRCHHILSLNGGPLLIPKESPVARFGEGRILLEHAYGGHRLKEVSTAVLYGHWPCGAAISAGLSAYDALSLCVEAKDSVRIFFRRLDIEFDVLLFFHVFYASNGKQRSYFFDRAAWHEWNKQGHMRGVSRSA